MSPLRASTFRSVLRDMYVLMVYWNVQAAWVAGQYADVVFTDQRHFTTALHRVVAALTDPELPVRVDSVVALRTFVEACKGMVHFLRSFASRGCLC